MSDKTTGSGHLLEFDKDGNLVPKKTDRFVMTTNINCTTHGHGGLASNHFVLINQMAEKIADLEKRIDKLQDDIVSRTESLEKKEYELQLIRNWLMELELRTKYLEK